MKTAAFYILLYMMQLNPLVIYSVKVDANATSIQNYATAFPVIIRVSFPLSFFPEAHAQDPFCCRIKFFVSKKPWKHCEKQPGSNIYTHPTVDSKFQERKCVVSATAGERVRCYCVCGNILWNASAAKHFSWNL